MRAFFILMSCMFLVACTQDLQPSSSESIRIVFEKPIILRATWTYDNQAHNISEMPFDSMEKCRIAKISEDRIMDDARNRIIQENIQQDQDAELHRIQRYNELCEVDEECQQTGKLSNITYEPELIKDHKSVPVVVNECISDR